MGDANFSGDLPEIIVKAAQQLQHDYSMFRIGYDNLRRENNKLSLENNKLIGENLRLKTLLNNLLIK